MVVYLQAERITRVERTQAPLHYNASGYGPKVPTHWLVTLDDNRKRRVYVACYANAGSAYVIVKGESLFLDGECEYRLQTFGK